MAKERKHSESDNEGVMHHSVIGMLGINNLELPVITMVTLAICLKFSCLGERWLVLLDGEEKPGRYVYTTQLNIKCAHCQLIAIACDKRTTNRNLSSLWLHCFMEAAPPLSFSLPLRLCFFSTSFKCP